MLWLVLALRFRVVDHCGMEGINERGKTPQVPRRHGVHRGHDLTAEPGKKKPIKAVRSVPPNVPPELGDSKPVIHPWELQFEPLKGPELTNSERFDILHGLITEFRGVPSEGRTIEHRLISEWVESDRLEMLETSREGRDGTADASLRRSLRHAEQSLLTARDVLAGKVKRYEHRLSGAEMRETLRALAREEDWLQLLRGTSLADNEAALRAVKKLTSAVKDLQQRSAVAPDFDQLRSDINFLLREINRAASASLDEVPHRYRRELLDAARTATYEAWITVAAETATAVTDKTSLMVVV